MNRSACVGPCSSSSAATACPGSLIAHRRQATDSWPKPQPILATSLIPQRSCPALQPSQQHALAHGCLRQRLVACSSSKREPIQGYTPANFISYTEGEQHRCHYMVAIEVQAPVNVCYQLWNDWTRLVDFLDLVAQIGLDPAEPEMGLFQCFYRWGRMPIMEIVFLMKKTRAETDKLIAFETLWGMPAAGEVQFMPSDDGSSTTVVLKFWHQLPWLLVDLKVGVLAVQTQMRDILAENLQEFKSVAEQEAAQLPQQPRTRTQPQSQNSRETSRTEQAPTITDSSTAQEQSSSRPRPRQSRSSSPATSQPSQTTLEDTATPSRSPGRRQGGSSTRSKSRAATPRT